MDADVTGGGAINPGDPQIADSVGYMNILGNYTAISRWTLPLEIAGEDLDDQDELYVSGAADIRAATYAVSRLRPGRRPDLLAAHRVDRSFAFDLTGPAGTT